MKVDIKNPKTEADYVYITMLLWRDIARKGLNEKFESKYYDKLKIYAMFAKCPLCELDESRYKDFDKGDEDECKECFISAYDHSNGYSFLVCGLYDIWGSASSSSTIRKKFAQEIFERCRDRFYDLREAYYRLHCVNTPQYILDSSPYEGNMHHLIPLPDHEVIEEI